MLIQLYIHVLVWCCAADLSRLATRVADGRPHELVCPSVHAGKLVGDVLLAATFVSYAGAFNTSFRTALVAEAWLPDLASRGIPVAPNCHPLGVLAKDITKARLSVFPVCCILPSMGLSIRTSAASACLPVNRSACLVAGCP
jgi:hypothetical protein